MIRAAAVLLALSLAACADPSSVGQSPAPSTPSAAPSYAPDALVLSVWSGGGLVPSHTLPEPPFWSLYGDGRVFTRGPEPAIYPGQALPNVTVGNVTRETLDRIVAAARAAGLDGEQRDYGDPLVADGSTTVLRLRTADGVVETSVYALQEGGDTGNDARRRLRDFLRDLTSSEGFGSVSDDEPYEPAAVAVFARPYGKPDPEPKPQDAPWTGADPATGEETRAGRCLLVMGAALAEAMPAFRKANTLTRWTHGTTAWSFRLRPLLPDEQACADAVGG